MAEIIGYIGRAQTLTAELSTPQTLTASFGGGGTAHGIPAGGEPGQGLIKVSDADYDVKWMDILPEDTASGAVASFPDGADDLPMGVVVDIDPVQDLHGFDNPWPGGGGKNKFDEQFRQGSALDLSNTARVVASKSIYVEQGKTYTFSASNYSAFNYVINSAQADSLPISGSYNYCGAGLDWLARTNTFTATNSGYVFVCVRKPDNSDIVPSDVANVKMQFEESSTATSYDPYSNICPISGRTGAKVTRTGRNVWDGESETGYIDMSNGEERASQDSHRTGYIRIAPSRLYCFANPNTTSGIRLAFYDKWKRFISSIANASAVPQTFTSPSNAMYARFYWANIENACLSLSSSKNGQTEPYTGVTHEISFSTEVYGGKLNVETGECVVDRAVVTLNGMERWTAHGDQGYWIAQNNMKKSTNYIGQIVCDKLPVFDHNYKDSYKSAEYGITGWGNEQAINQNYFYIKAGSTSATTIEDLRAWLQANPVTVVYTLATPITLTLDAIEMRSLLGDNNVWADTGDVSVTYKADIQKYINKKISAAVAAMS